MELLDICKSADLAHQWIVHGRFTHKGLTWRRGINENGAIAVLESLFKDIRVTYLAHVFDTVMCPPLGSGGIPAKGFTIGKGKELYWHITPMPSGLYKCYRHLEDGHLGHPRYIEPTKLVSVHY